MRIHPLMRVPLVFILVGGCEIFSPIKQLECVVSQDAKMDEVSEYILAIRPRKGEKVGFTFNTRTGENYEIDRLSEKLIKTKDAVKSENLLITFRSVIVGDEFRAEFISKHLGANELDLDDERTLYAADMKKMTFKVEKYKQDLVSSRMYVAEGKCKWIKPKTTEIVQK